jgi:23S rRNA (adenine2503-C2)-methyltransferase
MTATHKPNIKDMSLEEIEAFIADLGKERYRARQIMKWIYQQGAQSFEEMTTLAKDFRERLAELASICDPKIVKTQTSADATKKVLFRLQDGLHIESVLIPGKNHWTACLSTQVGCRMGCRFCLTGSLGFQRNLMPSEITGQMIQMRLHTPEGPNVKNIVLMGMGEPLANYDNTVKAIRNLTEDHGMGFSNRRITVSTSGLVPQIIQLGRDICVNLAISLNAPNNEKRSEIMPINRKYPIDRLLDACRDYPMPGRRMLTFEYILMAGFNDSPRDAIEVAGLLQPLRCKFNLIAFNEFPGSPFKTPSREAIRTFQQILLDHNYTAVLRASRGSDILAACGQLSGQEAS